MDTMEMGNTRLQGGEGMHRSWRYAPPPPSLSPVVPLPPLLSLGCHFVAHCRARDEPVVPPAHQASRAARALRTRRLHASARHPAGASVGRCCWLRSQRMQAVFGRCCWSSCTSPAGGGRLRTLGAASRAGSPRATGTRASSQASAIDHASGIFWRDALV